MDLNGTPKFRIYPSIGIARVGNGPATQDQVVFSPEVPWANLYDTENSYYTDQGALKKQAQRFYIYQCDDAGNPVGKIDPADYTIVWTAEVANKKPFWYDFNNSLDLSVQTDNQNLSPAFFDEKIAPGISAAYRNPNVLDEGIRVPGTPNYRQELVNSPPAVSVSAGQDPQIIEGKWPYPLQTGRKSKLAARLNKEGDSSKDVPLGTLEYDAGTLIFYPADGTSASLNPSDLNTDFADNANWYDDICDGRITAKITNIATGEVTELTDAQSAAWIATAPPDYAPQIQPLSTMYDLVCGTANDEYTPELSLVFPMFYRLYRMQWVNLGDFLSPSFKETIDRLTVEGKFHYIYRNDGTPEAQAVRDEIFHLFRNPAYPYNNEPIIPSKDNTDGINEGSTREELKLPYYPGDAIDYPGSPAQWFAIPPMIYTQLEQWREGNFDTPASFDFANIDAMGAYYQNIFTEAANNPAKSALLMTRAVLETLYGGGFHPGVELTWPMRHAQIYAENGLTFPVIANEEGYNYGFYGLREVRLNTATQAEQTDIFYNDFGLRMTPGDIADSMDPGHEKHWLWKITPGDLTKWMGIPWQSDAGSCQAVYTDSQYPVPAWWAANLPVYVLTAESFEKIKDPAVLTSTKQSIYGNRQLWLQTTNTGYVGYHAEAGYQNGLINMVYQWKEIGIVAGRNLDNTVDGIPEIVYVSFSSKDQT